jgi:hypothetical protein
VNRKIRWKAEDFEKEKEKKMLKCKPICDELGKECSFSQPTPGSLSSTTTTSADEKFEALLNKYFRQVDVMCVCVGIGRQFSCSFLLEKKKKQL